MYSTVTRNRTKAQEQNRQLKQINLVVARPTPRKSFRNSGGDMSGSPSKHGDPNSHSDGVHIDDFSAAMNKQVDGKELINASF